MHRELETILVDFDEETGVGRITLNRPDVLNAMNEQMTSEILTALELFEEEDEAADGLAVRVVVMEGAGEKAFCSGADISGFSERNPADFDAQTKYEALMDFPAPVVAKIDGYCLGGGLETAFACDFRVASDRSTFGLPEVDLGLIPGGGGVQFISRLAGPTVAKEVAMTGEHLPAERAAELGIVNRVHPTDEFEAEVEGFVDTLASKAPRSVRAIKNSANVSVETGLREGLQYDRRVFAPLLETEDHREGAKAFAEKREPEFTGR